MMLDLFSKPMVSIERVGELAARKGSDSLRSLQQKLCAHEDYYPAIDSWIERKVIPGLKSGERIGYVGYLNEQPVLAAVLKRGAKTKFCHLSIEDSFRGDHWGELMFSLMASEVRHTAAEIHFTLPEGLWEREKGFFQSFGFVSAASAVQQYRLFEHELRCSAPFGAVWKNVLHKLPRLLTSAAVSGYDLNEGVVLAVHERHARAIMEGEKRVEVRKRFSTRWIGRKASVYSAGGGRSLLGQVTIVDVVQDDPERIWERHGPDIGCTKSEFDDYVGADSRVFAIRLADPVSYEAPVPLTQLSHLIGEDLAPPQSYSAFRQTDKWGRAVSVAALLHGSIRFSSVPMDR